MNLAIYTRGGRYFTQKQYMELKRVADSHSFRVVFTSDVALRLDFEVENIYDELPEDIDILLSYGGDGTFLGSVAMLKGRSIPIVGVNSGHLGFLSTISHERIEDLIKALSRGEYTIEERSLIEVECSEEIDFPYAFNEFTIQKDGMSMVDITLSVESKFLARYMADGVIFSTPSGSTAYSLSVGGAILSPDCKNFIISPIAAHNLNIRPLVLPDDKEYHIEVSSRSQSALITLDNRTYYIPSQSRFKLRRAEKGIEIVKLESESFVETLREKMMWGYDARNR